MDMINSVSGKCATFLFYNISCYCYQGLFGVLWLNVFNASCWLDPYFSFEKLRDVWEIAVNKFSKSIGMLKYF